MSRSPWLTLRHDVGTPEPRDRTPGPSTFWKSSVFLSPIRSTSGRLDPALFSQPDSHMHSIQGHLLIHSQRGRVPSPTIFPCDLPRLDSTAMDPTRTQPPLPCIPTRRLVCHLYILCAPVLSLHSPPGGRLAYSSISRELRLRRHLSVSVPRRTFDTLF